MSEMAHRNSGKEYIEYDEKRATPTPPNGYVIDKAAEKKLVRKLDLLLIPIIFLL